MNNFINRQGKKFTKKMHKMYAFINTENEEL